MPSLGYVFLFTPAAKNTLLKATRGTDHLSTACVRLTSVASGALHQTDGEKNGRAAGGSHRQSRIAGRRAPARTTAAVIGAAGALALLSVGLDGLLQQVLLPAVCVCVCVVVVVWAFFA